MAPKIIAEHTFDNFNKIPFKSDRAINRPEIKAQLIEDSGDYKIKLVCDVWNSACTKYIAKDVDVSKISFRLSSNMEFNKLYYLYVAFKRNKFNSGTVMDAIEFITDPYGYFCHHYRDMVDFRHPQFP